MRVTFWGTRGSVPTPGPSTVRYGGNTACVEMRTDGGTFFIFDSGTGIRELGLNLAREGGPVVAHLMLGHTHWDHISGFTFFTPAFVPGNRLAIYGAREVDRSLREILAELRRVKYEHFVSFEWEKKWRPELAEPEIAIPHFAKWLRQHSNGE